MDSVVTPCAPSRPKLTPPTRPRFTQSVQTDTDGGELDVEYYFTPACPGDELTPPTGAEIEIHAIRCNGSPDLYGLLEAFRFDFNELHETIIGNHNTFGKDAE